MTRSRLAAARLRCDRLSAPAALSAAAQRYELAPAERARRARAAGHLCAPASRRASPHQHASKHVCKHAQSDPHSLAANVLVMTVWCCCPVELSGRRPQVRQQPPARSDPQQARAIRPARKLALWAGTLVRARVGLSGRPPYPPHARAPSGVCVCSIRSFDPSLPSLGRPRVAPGRAELEPLGQHQFLTRTRPLNVHVGQQALQCYLSNIDPPCQRAHTHQVNATMSRADGGDASAGGAQRQEARSCMCPNCTDRGRTGHPAARHRSHRGARGGTLSPELRMQWQRMQSEHDCHRQRDCPDRR